MLFPEFKELFEFDYLMQFEAIVERGGTGDVVQLDPEVEYFARNGITHVSRFICDYETGYVDDEDEDMFARGRIEVSVDDNGNITITGDADCDGTGYDHTNWQWFQNFRTVIQNRVRNDDVGLISWQLMERINASLEDEIEDLRRRSGDDSEDEDEEDETEAQDDESEDEEEVQESESGASDDDNEA
ncbi:hypothetical protein KCU65_g7852, partial [Aureobasidium melanogenum]